MLENLAATLLSLQNDSCRFVWEMFGVEPDTWQAEFLQAVDTGDNIAVRSGHGTGKTTALAWVVMQTLACFPFSKVPCTAPTQHQLSDLLWAEVARWLKQSKLQGLLQWTATRVGVIGYEESWFAAARACSSPDNLAGFHAPKIRYIVDEAAGVPDPIFEVIDGALTTAGAQLIMTGNPTALAGAFHAAFHKNRSHYRTFRVSSIDSPRVSRDYIEGMAKKWGEDSDIYRVRVLGDFPLGEEASFLSLELVESAVRDWHEPLTGDGECEMGVDVARYGDDETVFAIRRGGKIIHLEPRRGWAVTETAGRAIALTKEFGARAIKIDDSGVGGGVTDILEQAQYIGELSRDVLVSPLNFGGAGDMNYHNAVSVWYGQLKDMMRAGEIGIPDDEDLVAQLSTRHFRVTTKGKICIEDKDSLKRRQLPSPDRAEAVALAFAAPVDLVVVGHGHAGRARSAR